MLSLHPKLSSFKKKPTMAAPLYYPDVYVAIISWERHDLGLDLDKELKTF